MLSSLVLTMSASLYVFVCLSRKQPSASSQWKDPECVPIFTIFLLLSVVLLIMTRLSWACLVYSRDLCSSSMRCD